MRRRCFFVRNSLARITHSAISGSGADAVGLSLIQLLERGQSVLRLLQISVPLIGFREVGIDRLVAGFKLPRLLQMRDRIADAPGHEENAGKSNLRS